MNKAAKLSTQLPLAHRQLQYWRFNLALTMGLLFIWFLMTFVATAFAPALNAYSFLGIPLGFYLASQGSQIVFVAIIGIYALVMNRRDRQFREASREK